MRPRGRARILPAALPVVLVVALVAGGCGLLFPGRESWPTGSDRRVETYFLSEPSAVVVPVAPAARTGVLYRFAVFGDQRALAAKEWPAVMRAIRARADEDERLRFLIDTGDIVVAGASSDQFQRLRGILREGPALPYLVAVGNHELENDASPEARANTARFLGRMKADGSPGPFHFRLEAGPVRYLFLDSNDWAYRGGPDDEARRARGEAQLAWLSAQLDPDRAGAAAATVVVMHNPIVQSSEKHVEQAAALWSLRHEGRTLAEILYQGGVDLVLTGHTHTFERFQLSREGGRTLEVVNFSGRPRPSFLWFGAGTRASRDIRGREVVWMRDHGWRDLDGWTIEQVEFMSDPQRDQFGIVSVHDDGALDLELCFLEDVASASTRCRDPVRVGRKPPQ